MLRRLLALFLLLPLSAASAADPARVLIVGTYHFANSDADIHNVESVDVMTPDRQGELQAVVDGLARFEPTLVAVEWPADYVDERFARYRDGTLEASRNEVVQLGFRLAAQAGLERVHGIDVKGEFPMEPLQAWASDNGREQALAALLQEAGQYVGQLSASQATSSIGQVLRAMNRPEVIEYSHGFYTAMLRFGAGDEQPGAALNAAWTERNLMICARLLQKLEPGDRAVLFFGQGHAHLLRRCVIETPGVELVEANDYLPDAGRVQVTP